MNNEHKLRFRVKPDGNLKIYRNEDELEDAVQNAIAKLGMPATDLEYEAVNELEDGALEAPDFSNLDATAFSGKCVFKTYFGYSKRFENPTWGDFIKFALVFTAWNLDHQYLELVEEEKPMFGRRIIHIFFGS